MNRPGSTVFEVHRRLLIAFLIAVAAVACSEGSATDTTATTGATDTTSAPGTTGDTQAPTSTPTTPEGPTTTLSDRPLAPDFTLELGDGGAYTLSEGAKPVYLVFWAEW